MFFYKYYAALCGAPKNTLKNTLRNAPRNAPRLATCNIATTLLGITKTMRKYIFLIFYLFLKECAFVVGLGEFGKIIYLSKQDNNFESHMIIPFLVGEIYY